MIKRLIQQTLRDRLDAMPAVALIGPRQVGKTTIANWVSEQLDALYLDLESERQRAGLREPEVFLEANLNRLVILDEVHRVPALFPILRGMIDRARRSGNRTGRYLLLGSASVDLLKQSGESLAGRISYLELHGLNLIEIQEQGQVKGLSAERLWLRGSFPDSTLAKTEDQSVEWRSDFIRTYLERDVKQFAPRLAAETLRRFWTMLAHNQGGLLNNAELARNMGVDVKSTAGYLDLLVDLMLVRRLMPWHANVGKRLIKSPKIYIRDSGLVHNLLRVDTLNTLLAHPVVGASWEGFVIEQISSVLPRDAQLSFYRTSGGAEIDLLVTWPDDKPWAIEIKRSENSTLSRGFHEACRDVDAGRQFLVHGGTSSFPYAENIQAVSVLHMMQEISAA